MNGNNDMDIENLINGSKYLYSNISVDCAIFGYHERDLKILLIRPLKSKSWTLAGGYVFKTESLDEAAKRLVCERTELEDLTLFQFKNFSSPNRISPENNHMKKYIEESFNITFEDDFWMFQNFISIGYFALTEYSLVKPQAGPYMEECAWWDVNNLPDMYYDHAEIIQEALKYLRLYTYHQPIGYDLLPEKFTLPDLHFLYETILNKSIDIRNFQKKMAALDLIIKLDEQKEVGGHRRPYLYTFNKERYDQMIRDGEVVLF